MCIRDSHNQVDLLTIENKSENDFVSEVDKTAESAIIKEIKKAFPQHSILGEELSLIHISEPTKTVLDLVCRLLLEKKKKKNTKR